MPVSELFPGFYQITLPTPFPVGDVHTYLLWGETLTLFDTGLHYPPDAEGLAAAFAEIGVAFSDLDQIVISHSHIDHMGQARRLAEASGAVVYAHSLACGKLVDLEAYARSGLDWAMPVLDRSGLPRERHHVIAEFYAIIPRLAQSLAVDRCLGEGDSLRAGDRDWQVLFCPGHSGDLICFFDPERRILLGSDHLLAHISSNALLEPPLPGQQTRRMPLLEYWQSLERLPALDLDCILPGHGEVILDHRTLLARRRAQRDRRLDRIEALVKARSLDAWQIANSLFTRIGDADVFLALSEVAGHLDMLRAQGRVEVVQDHGATCFRAIS